MKKVCALLISVLMVLVTASTVFASPVASMKEENTETMKASSFESNNSDTSRPQDKGNIYVGYAITDGKLDADNSNWTGGATSITLNSSVSGEGFTAVRASGKDTHSFVKGKLDLTDESDGRIASDITGTGAAITAADGAAVTAYDMEYYSEGFARSFAVIEDSSMIIQNSEILAMGKDPLTASWVGYSNSDDDAKMISAPWVLGVQGGVRAVNVLGKNSSLIVADSTVSAGGSGAISSDNCEEPYLYVYDSTLNIVPESAGGMNSGWKILGYDEDAYGSGFASSAFGGAQEHLYGVTVNGATYAAILSGGEITYSELERGKTYKALNAKGDSLGTYVPEKRVPAVINSVFGFMADDAGTVNVLKGTAVNTEESTFLYKDADVTFNVEASMLNPANGIILEMIDNDAKTVGGADPFETYLSEEAGFPAESSEAEGESNTVELNLANGSYAGDIYNATGYFGQAADALTVNIAADAKLAGDIALASHVHGIWLNGRAAEDVVKAIEEANEYHAKVGGYYKDTEPVEYVFLDENGLVTEDESKAVAVQFTRFSIIEYYLMGHVLNMVSYNGQSTVDVNVKGTWNVASTSLVSSLTIEKGAHVFGEIIELADGSILIQPSEEEAEVGTYGTAA